MSFTVGLDFGTHQTKVCIENATNPAQKFYEFLEFSSDTSNSTVLFPSIVQINDDDTISYGFVDSNRCKTLHHSNVDKPELKLIPEPILELPQEPVQPVRVKKPKPKPIVGLSLEDQLEMIKKQFGTSTRNDEELTREEKESIKRDKQYVESHKAWQKEKEHLRSLYEEELREYKAKNEAIRARFERELANWHELKEERMYYRYFKLASLSNSMKWKHSISADIISIWYLTFVLFTIREKFGENFFIQMGVPSGMSHDILKRRERKACSLLISSYRLVELYGDKSNYLAESYSNLLEFTEIVSDYNDDDLLKYGLGILPEAYAGLLAVTQKQRIGNGISILVDIGGGTTDIAIFTIRNSQPDVHEVVSIPKGLNYIFENLVNNAHGLSIADAHSMFNDFNNHRESFNRSIEIYYEELKKEIEGILTRLRGSFAGKIDIHGLSAAVLEEALKGRPIVFCGGGAMYDQMRQVVLPFVDKKLVNKDLLNISGILNKHIGNELFTILATSFGLSIPVENEIGLTPIYEVFDHIIRDNHTTSGNDYEHGLTDM